MGKEHDIAYHHKVNCNFSEIVFQKMATKRYGIKFCCTDNIIKADIDKQLLDLNAIVDFDLTPPCVIPVEPPVSNFTKACVYSHLESIDWLMTSEYEGENHPYTIDSVKINDVELLTEPFIYIINYDVNGIGILDGINKVEPADNYYGYTYDSQVKALNALFQQLEIDEDIKAQLVVKDFQAGIASYNSSDPGGFFILTSDTINSFLINLYDQQGWEKTYKEDGYCELNGSSVNISGYEYASCVDRDGNPFIIENDEVVL